LMPVGNTAQRPAGVTGQFRFNQTINSLEIYDNTGWTSVGQPDFTLITDQQFIGDGSTTVFTLSANATTAGSIVSINGVQQLPVTAYAVTGTTLTFTEAPAVSDIIDVRVLVTTNTIYGISNSNGNAQVNVQDGSNVVAITGSMSVAGDVTVGGNITVSGNVAANQINNGASAVQIPTANGNVNIDVGNVDNMAVFTSTAMNLTGNISATGNITGSYVLGNGSQLTGIDATQIVSGTSNAKVVTSGGNISVSVGGTSNVAVFATTGLFISGNISATGDVIAQNVNSLSDASLKANVAPIENAGQVVEALNGVGYDWVDGSGHAYGLIAQEVEQVVPEAVKTDAAGVKSVNYSMLVPFLIESVKQLSKEVAELKASK